MKSFYTLSVLCLFLLLYKVSANNNLGFLSKAQAEVNVTDIGDGGDAVPDSFSVSSVSEVDDYTDLKEELRHINNTELSIFMQLKERRKEIEQYADELKNKENVINATKSYIESRIGELRSLQKDVEMLLKEYKREEQARISSLVKIYENMKPQDAAQIFENLDMATLLAVVDRMKEVKVAPILAKMHIEKAREVTVQLVKSGSILLSYNNVCRCDLLDLKGPVSMVN